MAVTAAAIPPTIRAPIGVAQKEIAGKVDCVRPVTATAPLVRAQYFHGWMNGRHTIYRARSHKWEAPAERTEMGGSPDGLLSGG